MNQYKETAFASNRGVRVIVPASDGDFWGQHYETLAKERVRYERAFGFWRIKEIRA